MFLELISYNFIRMCRFGRLWSDPSYVLAALTHPFFKSYWIENAKEKESAHLKLKQLITQVLTPISDKSSASLTDDFLNFDHVDTFKPDEADFFLKDPDKNMKMLNKYPQIKEFFIRYNTTIPTSAPVERLFSQASLILTVRRNRLSDSLLEMLLLLKVHLKQ